MKDDKANIILENETSTDLSAEQIEIITNVINISLEILGKNPLAEVGVTIVSDYDIKRLNNQFRDINSVTDVLSFPMINFYLGEDAPSHGDYILGDIVFSLEMAHVQAQEYGHSVNREIGFFVAHSMLHLFGYDHENEEDEQQMLQMQEKILQTAQLLR